MHRNLWKHVEQGRSCDQEAFEILIDSTEESRFDEAVDEIPDDILVRFLDAYSDIGEAASEEALATCSISITQLELRAWNFDMELAIDWKRDRIVKLYALCRERHAKNVAEQGAASDR